MEKEKSGKGLVVFVIVLSLLVLGLGGYIVYDKLLSSNSNQNNNLDNNSNTNELNNNSENNKTAYEDEVNNELNNNNLAKCGECPDCKYTIIDYSNLFDMGSGNIIGSVSSYNEDGLKLNLYSNGKLYYIKKKESISTQKEIQISDIVKIVSYSNPGAGIGSTFYMLNKDGKLYSIDEKDIINGNVIPTIVSDVPKFTDIGIWDTYKPNAGGGSGIFGVTTDGKAYSVKFNSV